MAEEQVVSGQDLRSLAQFLAVDRCMCSHQLLDEGPIVTILG